MKKVILSLVMASALFFSCSSDDNNNGQSGPTPYNGGTTLTGRITGNVTLDASIEYSLNGAFEVASGGALTIPAGTVIKATGGNNTYMAVERGAKIYINGESGNPVVMTSGNASPAKEDWGGLVICGDAPTNLGNDVVSEVAGLTYGGNNSSDDSGVIKFLKIEYTGATFNANKEFNGVSFFGVGNGTTVNNIYAYESGDDGIEFFGGTVNASNLAIVNAYDDSLDVADGYNGTIDNVYISGVTKAGMEISNNGDNEAATPETNATINNVTVMIGSGFAASENVINYKEGGGNQTYTNLVFSGFSKLAKYSSDNTTQANIANKLTINSYRTDDTVDAAYDEKDVLNGVTNSSSLNGAGNGYSAPSWLNNIQ